jgi:hypothetical protein
MTIKFKTPTEVSVITPMFATLADIHRTAPAYFAELECADLETGSRATLVDLMARAPTDQLKFFLLGKLSMRLSIQILTGRELLG